MKKVLIFSLTYFPAQIGGAEVAVKEITDRIDTKNISFDMITLSLGNEPVERLGRVNVYRIGWGGHADRPMINIFSKLLYIPLAYWKALNLHKENKYDMTWALMASYAGLAAALFKRSHKKIPFVLTIQEGDNFERRQGIFNIFFRKIFLAADRIQAISTYLADWAKDMGARCPISVVPNGVDVSFFSGDVSDERIQKARHEINKQEGDIVLVTTSRLVKKNAVDDIVQALTFLPSNIKLLIIGSGAEEKSLRHLVRSLILDERAHFLGFVSHTDLLPYMRVSDIFVRPSLSEGFGNSFVEAMAAHLPVIATDVGGIKDFLTDRETGLVVEANKPKDIADKVALITNDKNLRIKIVEQAYQMVKEKYDWSIVSKAMESVFSNDNQRNF